MDSSKVLAVAVLLSLAAEHIVAGRAAIQATDGGGEDGGGGGEEEEKDWGHVMSQVTALATGQAMTLGTAVVSLVEEVTGVAEEVAADLAMVLVAKVVLDTVRAMAPVMALKVVREEADTVAVGEVKGRVMGVAPMAPVMAMVAEVDRGMVLEEAMEVAGMAAAAAEVAPGMEAGQDMAPVMVMGRDMAPVVPAWLEVMGWEVAAAMVPAMARALDRGPDTGPGMGRATEVEVEVGDFSESVAQYKNG